MEVDAKGCIINAKHPNGAQDSEVKKMNTTETVFAVVKAYCAINVLLLPRSFANGGYMLSPIAMMVACFFEALCAARLT